MARWMRFVRNGKLEFGTLDGDTIAIHRGDMFAGASPTGDRTSGQLSDGGEISNGAHL